MNKKEKEGLKDYLEAGHDTEAPNSARENGASLFPPGERLISE